MYMDCVDLIIVIILLLNNIKEAFFKLIFTLFNLIYLTGPVYLAARN